MTTSRGQLAQAQDLQSALDQVVAAGAPGLLARVLTPADTLSLTSGVADRSTGAPMTPEMHFRIGSATKTFVATVVLQLAGDERLSLDDRVSRWLPWLSRLLPQAGAITVRQVLNQTSGLFDYTQDPAWLLAALGGKTFRPEELVLIAALHPLTFAPGTDWRYSNTGYVVAGLIIEKITGQSLRDELGRRIFEPLALEHTTYPTTAEMPTPHPRGYVLIEGLGYVDTTTTIHPSAYWGCGGVVSNAADLATFFQALLGGSLLGPDLLDAMKTTGRYANGKDTQYGLGLARLTTPCGVMWGHGGNLPGYFTFLAHSSPEGSRSAVIMMNTYYDPSRPLPRLVEAMLNAIRAAGCRALEQTPPLLPGTDEVVGLLTCLDNVSALSDVIRQTQHARPTQRDTVTGQSTVPQRGQWPRR